jgi:non-ribosomal peptide synthetase component E (peptide arylation enzyme)
VSCHPRQPLAAVGYADGAVMFVRIDDGALIAVRAADGQPVSALGWDATGQTLAFGAEAGEAGVLVF